MPKFRVLITETVTEVREYEFDAWEASSDLHAAGLAYKRWIIDGEEPKDGPSMVAAERTYEVDGIVYRPEEVEP